MPRPSEPPRVPALGLALLLLGAAAQAAAAELQGRVDWPQARVLTTPLSGVVAEVVVEPGQQVEAGQLLLRLDRRGLQARHAAAEARVEALRLEAAEAGRELARAQDLYRRTVAADHEVKLAEIAAARARAALAGAEAALRRLELDLGYAELRAPVAGRVTAIEVRPGQAVVNRDRAEPLLRLRPGGGLRVRARLPLAEAAAVGPGGWRVEAGGRQWPARLGRLERPDPRATELDLELELEAGTGLVPGQQVRIIAPDSVTDSGSTGGTP